MEFINLIGTEGVENAGRNMQSAAETMRNTAGNLEDSLFRHRQFLEDWLLRLETIINEAQKEK